MKTKIETLRKEIVDIGVRIYNRGLVASNDGNISVRIDEKRVLITPTGVSKGFMKPEDLIIVDMSGKLLEGSKKQSSEANMHLKIYKDRPDVKSVCHTHAPYSTAYAVAGISLDKMILPEVIIMLGKVPLVEYGATGTEELYGSISKYIKDYDAFLLANHGVVTVGKSILEAYFKMESLEHAAKIQFLAQQMGNVNVLNKAQCEQLFGMREKFGIRKDVGLKGIKTKREK